MLAICANITVSPRDILLIVPVKGMKGIRARVFMADGRVLDSAITASTLQKRLREEPLCKKA